MQVKDMRTTEECPECRLCGRQIKDAGAVVVHAGEAQYHIQLYVYYHIKCVKEFADNAI